MSEADEAPEAAAPATEAPSEAKGGSLAGLIRAMRPHQWVKNAFVVAPLVFAKGLGDVPMMTRSAIAFALFSFAASSIYLMNDLADVESDRAHPKKRHRPIASGQLSVGAAKGATGVLMLLACAGSLLLNPTVLGTIAGYIVLQIAYTFSLKRVPYVDVLCIAAGFELRVLCGSFALGVQPSVYLLVVTLLLSLFLGFGKRMHELKQAQASGKGGKTRKVLEKYSDKTLMVLLQGTALATTLTYVLYTLDPTTREFFGTDYLAATIVFTQFGVSRFLDLVRNKQDADSPTEQMLKDWPFLLNLVLWAVAIVVVIYVT